MEETRVKIAELERKLQTLIDKQQSFLQEFSSLQAEINSLKSALRASEASFHRPAPIAIEKPITKVEIAPTKIIPEAEPTRASKPQGNNSNLEKFVGENLINKVGIVITILGVGWGVKYSIDNQLISPFTRMLLGYLFSAALLGLSYYLKKKYENYSAVLLSGSLAMMYFITYFGHSSYGLIGRVPAFGLMVLFTIYTVAESLRYNRAVIAHIGLVGAYAVPFLLSDGSGRVLILFSYMAIINSGILFLAFKRNWKSLFYSAFAFTWVICIAWKFSSYESVHRLTGLVFITFFFLLFKVAIMVYKLYRREVYTWIDACMLVLNSLVHYILCMSIIPGSENAPFILTCILIAFHATLAYFISKKDSSDTKLVNHIYGIAIALITIAIPIKLNKEWVTIAWSIEALGLIWLYSKLGISIYRNLFQCVLIIAFTSLLHDWSYGYDVSWPGNEIGSFTPIFNFHFASSLFVSIIFLRCGYFVRKIFLQAPTSDWKAITIAITSSAFLLVAWYGTFFQEINYYWTQMLQHSFDYSTVDLYIAINNMLNRFNTVWILNYTILFVALVFLLIQRFAKSPLIQRGSYVTANIVILLFLTIGLGSLSSLRSYYQEAIEFSTGWNLYIRYFSYSYLILLLWSCYRYAIHTEHKPKSIMAFDFLLHITCLWVLSAELLHWRALLGSSAGDKTGLSILWGAYSLFLIVVGIIQKKSYLRVAAMAWLGVTLIKLFFYDLSELSTLSKTIVLVILGVVLLIISFLYNKYKTKIFGDEG